MKKALALIAALLLTFGVVSCKKAPYPSGSTTSVEDTATEPSPAQSDVLRLGEDEILKFAQPFCDGAAWVFVSSKDGARGRMLLIDTEGKILFRGPEQTGDHTPGSVTNFHRGVCLYEDNGARYLIGCDGRVIFCDAEDGMKAAHQLFGGADCVTLYAGIDDGSLYFSADHELLKNTYFNGYSVAACSIGETEKYGILSPDGSFAVPFSDVYAYSFELGSGTAFAAFRYDRDSDFFALDYKTKTLTDLGRKNDLPSGVIYPHESETTLELQRKYELEKGEGLLYSREKKGFVDASGEVVIDLSGYSLAEKKRDGDEYIPYFHGGKCVITFISDGKPYFAVIDRKGKMLADPVPFPSDDLTDAENNRYAYVSEGTVVFTKESDPEYYMYGRSKYGVFFGEDGRVREDLGKYAYVYPFSDGIALTLDESGEYNYIDKNGNILFR